ncbi:divergent polysaccharide deacetylase family protein [Deferribacteraceae bacterium V6Fe1]|nr:divergent polysaccharide deacetylase family protein [Deferribacteraceae bacterium V6Fe1]
MPRKAKSNTKRTRKKSFKIPPGLIVGGTFFLLLLVIIFSIINLKVSNLKSEVTKANTLKKDITLIENRIKLLLFDYELDKDHFKKYVENNVITFELTIPENQIYGIRQAVISLANENGFNDNSDLLFYKNNSPAFKVLIIPFTAYKNTNNNNLQSETSENIKNDKHKIAIILDDAGNSLDLAEEILKTPYKITLSVIPFTQYDRETAEMVKKYKKELFLHLPMQPKSYPSTDPGKGAILLNTPESLINIIIKKDIERLGKVDGANNHMGSALTENTQKMKQVLKYLKKYTDTFVDSHTAKNTVAYDVCKDYMTYCGINNVFIDNVDDADYIKDKINKGINLLEKEKKVIMIGHLRPTTVKVLMSYLPELEKKGIKFSTVNEVLAN